MISMWVLFPECILGFYHSDQWKSRYSTEVSHWFRREQYGYILSQLPHWCWADRYRTLTGWYWNCTSHWTVQRGLAADELGFWGDVVILRLITYIITLPPLVLCNTDTLYLHILRINVSLHTSTLVLPMIRYQLLHWGWHKMSAILQVTYSAYLAWTLLYFDSDTHLQSWWGRPMIECKRTQKEPPFNRLAMA